MNPDQHAPADETPLWRRWMWAAAIVLALAPVLKACAEMNPTAAAVSRLEQSISEVDGVDEVSVRGLNDAPFHTVLRAEVVLEPTAPPESLVAVSAAMSATDDDRRWLEFVTISQVVDGVATTVRSFDEHPEQVAELRDRLAAAVPDGSIAMSGTTLHTLGDPGEQLDLPAVSVSVSVNSTRILPEDLIELVLDLADTVGVQYTDLSILTQDGADPVSIEIGAHSYDEVQRNGAECLAAIRAAGIRPTGVDLGREQAYVWIPETDLPRAVLALAAVTDPDVTVLASGTPRPGSEA